MNSKTRNETIILPEHTTNARVEEINRDLKWSAGALIVSSAIAAAGAVGTYAAVRSVATGEEASNWALLGPPTGMLSIGAAGAGLVAATGLSMYKERRTLKKQLQVDALSHYQNNQALYQEEALQEAIYQRVEVNGWPSPKDTLK